MTVPFRLLVDYIGSYNYCMCCVSVDPHKSIQTYVHVYIVLGLCAVWMRLLVCVLACSAAQREQISSDLLQAGLFNTPDYSIITTHLAWTS